MAAVAVLQPSPTLNQSLDMNSLPGELSQARQRRKKSTKKFNGPARPANRLVQSVDLTASGRSSVADNGITSELVSSVPESTVGSIDSALTDTAQPGTARERRRTRLKRQIAQNSAGSESRETHRPQSAGVRALPELEDSTIRVANLLQENLQSVDESEAIATKVGANGDTSKEQREHPITDRPLPELVPVSTGDSNERSELCTDILGITIHKTDHLKASVRISHPCVRITVVDSSLDRIGQLLKKSQPDRCVTWFYERGNPNVDYILPVLTQPCNCSENSDTLQPKWEETIILNEELTQFTENENVIIFFELLDFSTTSSRGISRHRQRAVASSEKTPWHRIAWGFLKPAGKISKSKVGQRTRVQLYKFPKRRFRSSTEGRKVFDLWLNHYRIPYPSTLYITVKALSGDTGEEAHLGRSTDPTLAEVGTFTFEQLVHKHQSAKSVSSLADHPSPLLSETTRLPGHPCQVPTTHLATLRPTKSGCSSLKFSQSGRLLAAGCADNNNQYPIIIYKVPSFEPLLVTEGHKGIVYDMCWDSEDNCLATASGDGLVKVWSMSSSSPEPVFILPHPCYVYCVCFVSEGHIFTGAYDGNIRLWAIPQTPTSPQLVCELRCGGSGLVNCLVWHDGTLYTGDSHGEVGVWREEQNEWSLHKKISVFKECALTSMCMHPNGRKLLLHTTKGSVVLVDLRIDRVCCEYCGRTLTQSQHSSSLVSPCGRLVFAAGPCGVVHVWNTDDGNQVFSYSKELPIKSTVSAMVFHPNEQMVVFSAFGTHEPIVAMIHKVDQPLVPAKTTRRKIKNDQETSNDVSKINSSFQASARWSELAKTLNRVTALSK